MHERIGVAWELMLIGLHVCVDRGSDSGLPWFFHCILLLKNQPTGFIDGIFLGKHPLVPENMRGFRGNTGKAFVLVSNGKKKKKAKTTFP